MNLPRKYRILVVEDEQDIQELIALHLGRNGYAVESVSDGEEALQVLRNDSSFDLFVLDWMLPGLSGLDITKFIRGSDGLRSRPILMVTARMEAADIVMGLEAGADDYVTKPFEIPVLVARVRALLRRSQPSVAAGGEVEVQADTGLPTVFELGGLKIDQNAYEVRCAGEPIQLTPSEFKLMIALAQNRGRVMTRERLIEAVQGAGVVVVDRAIDTHVFGLRKKLGPCADVIETVRGVGYRVKGDN